MKKILLACILACLGFACWHQYKGIRRTDRSSQVEKHHAEQPKVALTTPASASTTVVLSPVPVASVAPTRHVSPAGTFTKEQLLSAINKDAKESSLEELLGPPAYRKEHGWSSFSVWTDKLDTGGDSPAMFTAEIAKYNGTPLVVRIYDPSSGSSTSLPWHDKVLGAYNEKIYTKQANAYNDQVAAYYAAQNAAQLEVYKQAARDVEGSNRAEQPRYVSSLSLPASTVGAGNYDQPVSVATSGSTIGGRSRTETDSGNAPHLYFQGTTTGGWRGPVRTNAAEAKADAYEHSKALGGVPATGMTTGGWQ